MNNCFWKRREGFFPPTHFWYLGLMRSVKAILFTCVGYRGRYWIQSLLCFKEQILQNRKKQPPPCYPPFIILKGRILWSKPVRDFFYCLHTKLPVGSFSTQTSYPQASWEQGEQDYICGIKSGGGGVPWSVGQNDAWSPFLTGLWVLFESSSWRKQEGTEDAAEYGAQPLPWLTCSAWAVAVAPAGGSVVMSALLQECTSHHPSCFPRLLYSPGMIFFRLLCVGERKYSHITVCSPFLVLFWFFGWFFFWTLCSLTSKYKLSSHQLVFDLPLWLQASRRRKIKARNG